MSGTRLGSEETLAGRCPKAEVRLHIGGVYASREPSIVKTLLGSCVAACLFDPVAGVGGMNHFMLPVATCSQDAELDAARFGVHAMDCLIGALQKAGAQRRRLRAKVFGGGQVLRLSGTGPSVAERNVAFIREFMVSEDVPLVSSDLGGYLARQVHFHTDTGKAYVRRVTESRLAEVRSSERVQAAQPRNVAWPFGDVTLFDA